MKIYTKTKFLLLFLFLSAYVSSAFAQVIVTQPTGGQNVSVDKSTGGPLEQFTAIGDIVISDQTATDFGTGTNQRIRLNAPTGWQFETNVATVSRTGTRVTAASVYQYGASYIIIQYTANSTTAAGNSITLSGLRVKSTSKNASGVPGNIVRSNTASNNNAVVAGLPADNAVSVATLSRAPGAFKSLQVLLPGQINNPAVTAGKSGTIVSQTAGATFPIVVNAVDYANNIVSTAPADQVSLTSTNPYPNFPPAATLSSGTVTFNVALNRATASTITATNDSDIAITPNTSSSITPTVGPYTKLLVVFPGETLASGAPTGKTGTATAPVSAANYVVTVYAVDDFFNRVASNNNITVSASGVTNYTQPAANNLTNSTTTGRNFTLIFRTVGETPNITATNNTTPGMNYSQSVPAVVPAAFNKLQILLPGESAAPFTTSGKTGTPIAQAAGVPFNVTVNAVDANWNVVTNGSADVLVGITNTVAADAAASLLPPDATLSAGTGTFSVVLRKAASQSLKATNLTTIPAMAAVTSATVVVNRGAYNKLLITLTGETHSPGTATGKTNTVTTIASNATTTVTVRAVDAYWNLVNNITEVVQLTSTDPNIVFPTNNLALVAGVRSFSNVRFRTSGNQTITATSSDVTKNYTTDPINVTAGAFVRYVVVLPGESSIEGVAAGKSGTPSAQLAGESFNVLIRAIDAYGNTVTSENNTVTFTASNDIYAQLPPNTPLSSGVLNATVTYRIGSASVNRRLNVTDALDNTKTGQSSAFAVNIGPYAGLLIVLPGEAYAAGAPTGKTGVPANQAIGTAFNIVTVRAVDAAFNTVVSITDEVRITSNDLSAVLPANASLVAGAKNTWPVTLNSASSSTTLTATSMVDATKNYTTAGIVVLGASSINDFFRSAVVTGVWNNSSSWESSATGVSGWQPSTRTPTNSASGISIRTGHTISITASVTVDDVVIDAGGQVNLTGGTLAIANGASPNDFSVSGTFRYSAGAITTTGVLQFANGGKYQHAFTTTSGTIPTATWATGSICEVVGYTAFAADVSGSNQTFSNFVWNASAQTGAGSPSLLDGFVARDFTVTSTGSGSLNLGSIGGNTIITRDYLQTAGNVVANKTSGTQNLAIGGDFLVNGGTFALGNGTVNLAFNGSSQTIENAGTEIQFQNVAFTGGGTKTLNAGNFAVASTGVLTLGANTTLNAGGRLSLISNELSSGTIAAIPPSSSITGSVTVQRFVTGGSKDPFRTYRMFSSPIHTGANTYDLTQFIDDIHITGKATNGFDEINNSATSAWYYDPTTTGFKVFPNINTSVAAGQGVYLLYRGDRTSNLTAKFTAPGYANPENVVMDFSGIVNQHNITVPLSYSAGITGFNFLGNPYPSSIDWSTVISSGATSDLEDNVISIWNPSTRQYATHDGSSGANGGSNIIPTGQGFFVRAKSSGGSFTFVEGHKSGIMPSNLLMSAPIGGSEITLASSGKMAAVNNYVTAIPQAELRTWLKKDNTPFKVENVVVFKDGKSASYVVKEDAPYLKGSEVYMSSLTSDNKQMVINYMPAITPTSKVKLDLDELNETGNYTLQLNYTNVPAGYLVKLTDNFLGTSSFVNNGSEYNFSIDKNNSSSAGPERLSVSFEAPTTLPVTYNSFNVTKVNEGVSVKWSTQTETNNNRFEVERAGDDKAFFKIHTEMAKGNNSSYAYIDKNPLLGNNYYRLVQVDNDNKPTANQPQVVNYTGEVNANNNVVSVFPNPVVSKFTVKYNGALKANQQTLKIVNATGQVLLTKVVNKAELTAGYEINIAGYAIGVYVIEVYEGGNQRIGQMKLVKQ